MEADGNVGKIRVAKLLEVAAIQLRLLNINMRIAPKIMVP
jgi:hypothetical protein